MTISLAPSRAPWAVRLDEVAAFVAVNGRLPSARGADRTERTLGGWLTAQRRRSDRTKGYVPLKPEEAAALNERIPGWRGRKALPRVTWEQRLAEVKTYRDAYGKWPSIRSTDPQVKTLAGWLNTQRCGQGMTADRRAALDAQIPGWDETPAQAWFRIADDIAGFRERVGEWPSYSSPEPSVRRLAKWLLDQRTGRNVSAEREAYLDRVLPGWRVGLGHGTRPLEMWEASVAAVERFRDAHGRLPAAYRDASESRLAQWLRKQRTDADMSSARRRVLDARLPGWDHTDRVTIQEWRDAQEASWRSKFDDVVAYVARNGKAPSRKDDASLYDWLFRLRHRKVPLARQALLDERLPGWRGFPSEIRRPVRAA